MDLINQSISSVEVITLVFKIDSDSLFFFSFLSLSLSTFLSFHDSLGLQCMETDLNGTPKSTVPEKNANP